MKLQWLHLPGLTSYIRTSQIQESFVQKQLNYKRIISLRPSHDYNNDDNNKHAHISRPDPVVITCQFTPTYTTGRREHVSSFENESFIKELTHDSILGHADFHPAKRGGQTTFHGPGQIVAYCIIDLKAHSNLGVRRFVEILEQATIKTCRRWGISTSSWTDHTNEDHGVKNSDMSGVWTTTAAHEQRKIAALGVHLRRGITSHGVGVNVSTDLGWFRRIKACGMDGKVMTSFEREGVGNVDTNDVARAFVDDFAGLLEGVEEVVRMESLSDELFVGSHGDESM